MTPARHIYFFKQRFAPKVKAGEKLTTFRRLRKRMPLVGDIADLRTWEASPYYSKQIHLCLGEITEVTRYIIEPYYYEMFQLNDAEEIREVPETEIEEIAHADGFDTTQDFFSFFVKTYPREWKLKMFLTRWKQLPTTNH
jgi:hypothetical protein